MTKKAIGVLTPVPLLCIQIGHKVVQQVRFDMFGSVDLNKENIIEKVVSRLQKISKLEQMNSET